MSPFDGQNDQHLISLSAVSAHALGVLQRANDRRGRPCNGHIKDRRTDGPTAISHGRRSTTKRATVTDEEQSGRRVIEWLETICDARLLPLQSASHPMVDRARATTDVTWPPMRDVMCGGRRSRMKLQRQIVEHQSSKTVDDSPCDMIVQRR